MSQKTAIIYARVSTARQAEEELPIQSQLDQCKNKATELDAKVLKIFTDEGISGKSDSRPAFQDAITYCDLHSPDYFITWSSSRFARNKVDAGFYKRRLENNGTRLLYVSMSIDTDKTEGWLLDGVMELFDELYSRQVAADTKRSMIKNAESGYWNGGVPPFGFYPIKAPDNPKRKKLAVHEYESEIIKEIFSLKLKGHGARSIAMALNSDGKKNKGKNWSKSTICNLLHNYAVIGCTVFNKENKATRKTRPRSEWIIVKSHDSVVSESDFNLVQEIMDRETNLGSSASRSSFVFTGILKCGCCGSSMQIDTSWSRGKLYSYYNCRRFMRSGDCENRRTRADYMDEWLLNVIADEVFSEKNLRNILVELSEAAASFEVDKSRQKKSLISRLSDLETKNAQLYSYLEDPNGEINLADLAPRLRANKKQIENLEAELVELEKARVSDIDVSDIDLMELREVLMEMIADVENPKKTRQVLSRFITSVYFDKDAVRIEYDQSRVVGDTVMRSCENWLPGLDSNQ